MEMRALAYVYFTLSCTSLAEDDDGVRTRDLNLPGRARFQPALYPRHYFTKNYAPEEKEK